MMQPPEAGSRNYFWQKASGAIQILLFLVSVG